MAVRSILFKLTKGNAPDITTMNRHKAEMEADLMILLDENGYPPVPRNEVYNEVFEQAENFKKYSE